VPSKPSVLANGGLDFQSIPNVTIVPPKLGSECVRAYFLTVIEENFRKRKHEANSYSTYSQSYSTTVPAEQPGQGVSKTLKELFPNLEPNLCRRKYSFEVRLDNSDRKSASVEVELHYEGTVLIVGLKLL